MSEVSTCKKHTRNTHHVHCKSMDVWLGIWEADDSCIQVEIAAVCLPWHKSFYWMHSGESPLHSKYTIESY